ncbi:SRPBCC family protein [Flaviaesturariibacter amylovorans]|uniref:SRPBCC family protein n=1 Tax=Flaviaesturariibacter amylovorans TaxID=1084520 RepID=A0ABP8HPC6_9BACT
MSVHVLKQVQQLPLSLEEAWAFFSHPKNLAVITPEHLNLKFTNELHGEEIYPGQIITYKVKPLLGIPMFWMTEITHVERLRFFVDEQRQGPYSIWHHEHHFVEQNGGVEMTDIIHYKLPFGPLGNIGHGFVKKELRNLFAYRRKKITELFGA